jgi:hypothetical protein
MIMTPAPRTITTVTASMTTAITITIMTTVITMTSNNKQANAIYCFGEGYVGYVGYVGSRGKEGLSETNDDVGNAENGRKPEKIWIKLGKILRIMQSQIISNGLLTL